MQWLLRGDITEEINKDYGVAYNEAMLSCFTDEEAIKACQNIRTGAELVIHQLWEFIPKQFI